MAVASEFRPTLRDELAPLRPWLRRAVAGGLIALVAVLALAAFIASRPNGVHVVAHRPVTWNLYHPRVLRPKWFEGADDEPLLYGVSVSETRAFALKALERRLAAIGLAAAAA